MNEDLEDIQDKINYLEWQLKNKLEEAASLKERVEGLHLNKAALIKQTSGNSRELASLIDELESYIGLCKTETYYDLINCRAVNDFSFEKLLAIIKPYKTLMKEVNG